MSAALLMSPESPLVLKGLGSDLVLAGYASVEMVDKQGDLITKDALKNAFGKFIEGDYPNVQLAHSNIQVGEVIPEYTDNSGRMWKSEVDDTGMFVVIQLRDDIEKAREVASEIRKGNLKSFSIGGQAFERVNKSDPERGDYREIRRMELHEVTICEKGINPEAQFRILKEDTSMTTEEPDVLTEMNAVLERLSKRLDDVEEGKDDKMAYAEKGKGDLPDSLDPDDDGEPGPFGDKKPDKKDSKKKDKKDKEDSKEGEEVEKDEMKKEEMEDVITTEYLQWLESTVKGAGFDPQDARAHFDDVAKGYAPGESGFDMRGQGSIEGAGEDDSGKRPKMDIGAGPSGNKTVIKSDGFVLPEDVSPTQLEEAYTVYKAAALEERFKSNLGTHFADRLDKELSHEADENTRQGFDAREPLADLQKAVLALSERIDNVSSDSGETITKSGGQAVVIPDTTELAKMSWDDVHSLATRALRGGDN
tara:strand:- start:216 stop:1646 length:1431 start_codon:yes stop_codon:yes gene_type:complete